MSKACGIYGLLPNSHKFESSLRRTEYPVGSGGYSDVWRAANEKGEAFSIKVLRTCRNNVVQVIEVRSCVQFDLSTIGGRFLTGVSAWGFQKFCRTVIVSKRTNHPNVLGIEGVAPDLFTCCMVSRWMGNGNMLEYLNRGQGHIDHLELVS